MKNKWEQIHTSSPSGALPLVSWSNVTIRICNAVSTKGSTESENRRWLYGTPRPTGSYAHTVFSNDVNIGNACRFSAQVKYWIHRLGATCISVGKETRSYNVKILNKCIFYFYNNDFNPPKYGACLWKDLRKQFSTVWHTHRHIYSRTLPYLTKQKLRIFSSFTIWSMRMTL